MSKQLEEIFNECVERLQQGDSIENCLMNYPQVAAELEILLRTTVNVHWRASMVRPRPEFKAYARAQFIGAQYAAAQERRPSSRPTIFSLQRAWVPALAMVLLLVFSSVGTAAASSNAMPDQPLYPVKVATEQVRLAMAFSDEAKAELNVQLVEIRSQEIATMAAEGKPEQVTAVTERLSQQLEAAEKAIVKIEETSSKQVTPATQVTPVSPPKPAVPPKQPTQPAKLPTPPSTTTKPTTKQPSTGNTTKSLPKPSTASTQKATTNDATKLRETLRTTISKNVTTLENARDKTPVQSKAALQKAIDLAKARQLELQQPGKGTTTKPTSIQPTSGNTTRPAPAPTTTVPKPVTPNPVQKPQSTTSTNQTPVNSVPVTPKGTSDNATGTSTGTGETSKPTSSTTTTNQTTTISSSIKNSTTVTNR
jgi:hypothetical protein